MLMERATARKIKEANEKEHKRILQLERQVNEKVSSVSRNANQALSSIDKELMLTRKLLKGSNHKSTDD